MYTLETSNIQISGNYIVIFYWENLIRTDEFTVTWKVVYRDESEDSTDVFVVIAIVMPCVLFLCCVFAAVKCFFIKKSPRVQPGIVYQQMNATGSINESIIGQLVPIKYYLENRWLTCSICFEE